jgi:hypothetical protein
MGNRLRCHAEERKRSMIRSHRKERPTGSGTAAARRRWVTRPATARGLAAGAFVASAMLAIALLQPAPSAPRATAGPAPAPTTAPVTKPPTPVDDLAEPVPGDAPSSTPSATDPASATPAAAPDPPQDPGPVSRPPAGQAATRAGVPATPATAAQTTAAAAPATFQAIAGRSCPTDAHRGYDEIGGYYDGWNGWYNRSGGSSSCGGEFTALPESGSASTYKASQYAIWWFDTGLSRGSCTTYVFVPNSGRAADVAGHPAYYQVLASRSGGTVLAWFHVDQTAYRGYWVQVGTFSMTNGGIAFKLVDAGDGSGGDSCGPGHLAAAQIKVSCSG